jgi:hypothetical protein
VVRLSSSVSEGLERAVRAVVSLQRRHFDLVLEEHKQQDNDHKQH